MPAVVLTLGERRALMGVLAGIAVAPVATMAYLAATGSLALAVADVVLFPARHYSDIQVVAFGASSAPVELPATAFFPVTFLLGLVLERLFPAQKLPKVRWWLSKGSSSS